MSIFDGMTGLLTDTFGGPVRIYPAGGFPVTIRGILRNRQIEVAGDDGEPVITPATVLRARKGDLTAMAYGDRIEVGDTAYRVRHRGVPESPASDGMIDLLLERIE